MTYRYGLKWNVRRGHPVEEIDEATARERFREGPQFSVSRITHGRTVPDYTLSMQPGGTHLRVLKYDEFGSTVEIFDFSEREGDDRLFMNGYAVYVYPDDETRPRTFSQAVAHKSWVFREDGTATCREVVKPQPDARISEYRDLDVSGHWRERPAFGEWDGFGEHPEPAGGTAGGPA